MSVAVPDLGVSRAPSTRERYPDGVAELIRRQDGHVVLEQRLARDGGREVALKLISRKLVREHADIVETHVIPGVFEPSGLETVGPWQALDRRCGGRTTRLETAPEEDDKLVQLRLRLKVLGEHVGGVHLARNLAQLKLATAKSLLHP